MTQNPIIISLPIADRPTSFRFYGDGLGFEPIGEPAEDGIPVADPDGHLWMVSLT